MTVPVSPEPDTLRPGITRADFYCGRYRISGDASNGDRRLVDALRDPTRQYLDLRRVRVTALDGAEPPAEHADALLSKADVEWVAVRAEPPRAEARLYGYVRKVPVRVALVLHTCRIEGTVHVDSGATDPVHFFLRGLEKGTERFVAVTEPTVIPAPEDTDETLKLAIVNRASVRLYTALR